MIDPYKNYKQISVNTMTKGEQLVLLFDKAIQRMHAAITFMGEEKFSEANVLIDKTIAIFNYLIVCLNRDYEISKDISELYSYINGRLVAGKAKKDKSCIEEILPIVIEFRDTWEEADRISRTQKQ